MIGSIIGDVIGSVYENANSKAMDFPLFTRFSRFTDDTVLTVAVADAILGRSTHAIGFIESSRNKQIYADKLKEHGRRFPNAGYGQMFNDWLKSDTSRGYGSYGNGSAMRVSPVGFAFNDLETVLREAKLSAVVTHNHKDAIRGAQAIASAVFLAREGQEKSAIKQFVETRFRYNLNQRLDDIRHTYAFDSSCNGSVPQAIIAFLESDNFEDAIRKAVSLGGDSDTIACMVGGIAQAFYKEIPSPLLHKTLVILDESLHRVVRNFNDHFSVKFSILE